MKLITAIIFFLFTQYLWGQIVSAPTGGVWNDTTTWIGNVIPSDSDNVVVKVLRVLTLPLEAIL